MRLLLAVGIALGALVSGVLVAEVAFVGVNWLVRQVSPARPPDWLLLGSAYGAFIATGLIVLALGWRRRRGRSDQPQASRDIREYWATDQCVSQPAITAGDRRHSRGMTIHQ